MIKVYFHLCLEGFSNCYIVGNEETKQALIIDPGKISEQMILHIEDNRYKLEAVLITHNHTSHYRGLETLKKIYSPRVYAADYELAGNEKTILKGDGVFKVCGIKVGYMAVPGHTTDSIVYKIGKMLFTGDAITAGEIGNTNNSYAEKILKSNITSKLLSQHDEVVLMPGHGPPSSIESERKFNIAVGSVAENR